MLKAGQGATVVTLKELTPVRMMKNPFYQKINNLYEAGTTVEQLQETLGRGRAKKGMFEGDLVEGELEIGQVAAQIEKIIPAEAVVKEFIETYNSTLNCLSKID